MTSPWDYKGPSPFTSTKEDKRLFGKKQGGRGPSITVVRPKKKDPRYCENAGKCAEPFCSCGLEEKKND